MKKLRIFLSLILLMAFFAVSNIYAVVDVTGTVTRSDRFEISISQGNSYVASAYFEVDIVYNGKTYKTNAICCEHEDMTPPLNQGMVGQVYFPGDPGYNKKLATALYYGYWGPGCDQYTGTQNNQRKIAATSMIASYVAGNQTWWLMSGWDFSTWLKGHVDAEDIPDNIAYYYVSPNTSNAAATYQSLGGIIEIEQNGELTIYKKDNYGKFIAGAEFEISGPDGAFRRTTDSEGKIYLSDMTPGQYLITEITAPTNMTNKEAGRSVPVTVEAGKASTYTRENDYPRGSVRLVKYDQDHRGATLGDATLAGAKFELCAAQDIYEGSYRVYTKDQVIATVTTDAAGNTNAVTNLPIGRYYYREIQASTGFLLSTAVKEVTVDYGGQYVYTIGEKGAEFAEKPIYGNIQITKKLGALDYDAEKYLAGVQFKATLKSDASQVYYSTISGANGICTFTNIPYGAYTIEEYITPPEAEKIANFDVEVRENGKTYTYTITDLSKDMKIAVTKNLVVENNWKTDAKAEGAIFTVFRDAACTNKVCTIGPTDANGYAISQGTMRTGTYYLKETTFPVGINPDALIPGENVTYRNKVYTVSYDNAQQGTDLVTVPITIKNEPVYGNISIKKKLGALDYDPEINLAGARFKATLKSNTSQVYYSTISGIDGICTFTKLPYGDYTIEEYITPPEAEKVANFDVMVSEQDETYEYTKVDKSKDMKIEIFKEILMQDGEKTDAVVEGAEFTVYRDAACTNKVCVIGPTNADGYAISGTMRTGTYYIKETKFPTGIDPDATIPGENVTYRNKVYSVTYNNQNQGIETVTVSLTVQNEPKRNDLEIFKEIGKTTNTPEFPLDQCEFTATLKSSIGTDQVFSRKCTAETDRNGYCIIEDLPYGEYVVEETKVSPISLKCANFDVFIKEDQKVQVEPYYKNIVDEPKVMRIKIRKVDADRKDTDAPDYTQGDASLVGAVYSIYRYDPQTDDYTEPVYDITVDHKDEQGYWCAESGDLLVGKYMVVEKVSHTEADEDGNTIYYSYAEGYLATLERYYFDQQPDLQTVKRTYHYDTSKEEVIRGSVEVIKYDEILNSSTESPAEGAILRLTLNSNSEKYYDLVINKDGYGEFVEEESREKYYPYTIPYGQYTITEIKESDKEEHTSFFIQPEDVVIRKQVQKEYRIETDIPVPMYLQIQKTDKDTGANVNLTGAKFKVWNCEKEEWISQMTYPTGNYTDEFETDEKGFLTLPHKLEAGDYIVYETQAPAGYYLEEAWRIPGNESDIGNAEKGGKYVRIDKAAMGVVENTPANTIDLFYKVDMPNEPLKGKLEIYKTGEMLTDSTEDLTDYGNKYTPVYTQRGLAGVTYDIIAAEDIKSPDGTVIYIAAGTKVDTITTGEDGIATTKDLYLGEYRIVETVTPEGYITDTDIENVVLENNTTKRVETTKKQLSNLRQKLKISFIKEYEDINFANGNDTTKYAVFGVYAEKDIKNADGRVVINKDSLMDVIRVEGEEKDVTSNVDLPVGSYYVQELDCSYPYTLSEETRKVELTYQGNTNEYITYTIAGFVNTFEKANLAIIKISTSVVGGVILEGNEMDLTGLNTQLEELLNSLKGMTISQAKEYIKSTNLMTVPGAKYKLYLDEECTQPLYLKVGDEFVEAEVVTDESGMVVLEEIPLGKYFLKETEAPVGYEISEEIVTISLDRLDKDTLVYKTLTDSSIISEFITKVDIFTGEEVPKCTFEIKDENGKVLLYATTDEKGLAYIPTDIFVDGKTYTYTEIEAPEIYNLNTEPHEFVAEFDENGKWSAEPIVVENVRKESTVTLEKLDFADSTAIPNCKFELSSLETDFVVEGVTDENGIYVFENIPYGKYTYTELEAPEEYIIDTEPHEITIDVEQIKIQVTNEKAPDTGDIQVVAIAGILVISVVGIVYVLKNKKQLVK